MCFCFSFENRGGLPTLTFDILAVTGQYISPPISLRTISPANIPPDNIPPGVTSSPHPTHILLYLSTPESVYFDYFSYYAA